MPTTEEALRANQAFADGQELPLSFFQDGGDVDVFEGLQSQVLDSPDIGIEGIFNETKPRSVATKADSLRKALGLPDRTPASDSPDLLGKSRFGTALALDTLAQSAGRDNSLPALLSNPAFTGMSLSEKLKQIRSEGSQRVNESLGGFGAKSRAAGSLVDANVKTQQLANQAEGLTLRREESELGSQLKRLQLAQPKSLSNKDIISLIDPLKGLDDKAEEGALRKKLLQALTSQIR